MDTVMHYTVQSGDTLSQIAASISAASGISWQQIADANPQIDPNKLQIGELIDIPSVNGSGRVLKYTILKGDTLSDIANSIEMCSGLTYQQILQDNPGMQANIIQVGQLIKIPKSNSDQPLPSVETLIVAANMGYWDWTYSSGKAPSNATMSIAFSGWSDIDTALQLSNNIRDQLIGDKFICIGGGNEDGAFTAQVLTTLTAAIKAGKFARYDGVAYDVEEGDDDLEDAFAESFAAAKEKGLKVLVTVSHSAPYGIDDAQCLMSSFFANPDIDFISPQLYTTGKESANDYDISHGVTWSQYADSKAKVVPSIVKDDYFADAQAYFAKQGVILDGYVQWSQVS